MDDVIITSPSFKDHLDHLTQVFTLLRDAGLTLNKEKCHFARDKLKYLGLIISKEGIETDIKKIRAITEMKPPKNNREMSKFLGMTGWYQKFIPRYADICEPLYQLKKKGAKFNLSAEAQDSFDQIKRTLTEASILQLPNFSEQFNLFTDASGVGIGAVLQQNQKPIAFASRTLKKAELNYTVTERECLEVIWALNKFKTYFGPLPVKVITDHAALTKLTNGKNLSSRMIRWALKLSEFNIDWEHRPGVQNVVAFLLSRNPVDSVEGSQISCVALRALAINSREKFLKEQREDPELRHIYRYLENPDDGSVNAMDQFLHEFAFALRTAVNETTNKTPAELFLGRKIITPFSKLINVTEDTKYVGRNIEKLFDEARRNMRKKHKSWEEYYNRRRRDVHIKVNDLVLIQTHFLSAAGRKQVGKFMPKFEGPNRVLEINGNNLFIWKNGRRVKVNIDQVRVYRPRQTDTISSDSPVETLYDEQEVSHGSNKSKQGQFKEHRKTSSQESEGCRSRQGNTTREISRNKRKMSDKESKDQVLKQYKICRKRSLQGSEHQDRKRRAPEQRQGVKRSIPSSISSRTYKFKRPNTSSPGVESIAGPSRFTDRKRTASTTIGFRTEGSGRDDQTRQTRATTRGHNKQAEKPVRSSQATTRRPCPYYLRSRLRANDGIPEELRNIEINVIPHSKIRRRSLSMEALDGDPVQRI
ncbi:retrovirus-related Pol polyprotein from transposon opus [Trichonephila clavipes]|nr:retrovirus-related Pol polyprotein from transposon opus [Trichonephila clavipes]